MSGVIHEFYYNSYVLITGGTGFFGKILIQKLLRSCNGIGGIYLIVRERKGHTSSERFTEIFKDPVFDRLKRERPTFIEKIKLIEGDVSQPGLGLSQLNKEFLLEKINVVFHCAASMSMDAKIRNAVETNILGLSSMLDLCHEMRHLKSMVYVSTAYSNCTQFNIEERIYETPIEATTLVNLIKELKEDVLNDVTPKLLSKWPNTYCYTKAVAENMLNKKAGDLPAGVFRPSIVLSTYYDPIPGWTSNVYGPIGIMLASGLGLLRVFHCNPKKKFDIVPIDYSVNALICTAWEINKKWQSHENQPKQDIPVYNYSGGLERTLDWKTFKDFSINYEYPIKTVFWATVLILTNNIMWFNFLRIFLHTIPGYLTDLYLLITGKKTRAVKAYQKIEKFITVLSFFSTKEWNIVHENIDRLWNQIDDIDRQTYPFDMDLVNYKILIEKACVGIKLYILKENLDNVEEEKQNYQRMLKLHYAVKYTFLLIVIAICYKIVMLFI